VFFASFAAYYIKKRIGTARLIGLSVYFWLWCFAVTGWAAIYTAVGREQTFPAKMASSAIEVGAELKLVSEA
jgi:hypothetical protein